MSGASTLSLSCQAALVVVETSHHSVGPLAHAFLECGAMSRSGLSQGCAPSAHQREDDGSFESTAMRTQSFSTAPRFSSLSTLPHTKVNCPRPGKRSVKTQRKSARAGL